MARQILYIFLVFFVATAFALEVSTFRSNDFPVSVCSVKSFIERDFVSPQNGVLTLAEDTSFKVYAKIENSEVTAVAFEFNGAKIIYQNGLVKESNNLANKNLISKKKIQVRKYLSNSIVEFVTNNAIVKVSGNLRVISSISISVPSSAAVGISGACKALDRIKTVLASEATFPNAPSVKVPIFIMNDDASTFKIPAQRISSKTKPAAVDVVVVGGGLAGLTAASFISDFQELKVIVLEKESFLGGLAAGTHNEKGKSYSRGAAYFTKPFKSERLIMNHMGIVPHDPQAIEEPIDSFYNPQSTKPTPSEALKGYYRGIWEAEELKRLHVSFRIFALEMRSKHMDRLIANQPIERLYTRPEDYDKLLDTLTAKEWVSSLPCDMKERKVPGIEPLLKELEAKEGHFDCKNKYADHRMAPIFELLNLYSRSALGLHTDKINAEAFVNFYWAELQPRYTTPIGTQYAINTIVKRLESRPTVQLKTDSLVISVERDSYKSKKTGKKEEYAIVKYVQTNEQGQAVEYTIEADYVIYASQLGFAPQIIKNFAKDRPEQAKLMSDLEHVHYLVNEVTVEGHPWRSTYDLWVHNKDYTQNDPSDIIIGRWTELGGYKKYQDFKLDPPGDGIITVYHPMTYEMAKKPLNYEEAVKWAKYSVMRGLSSLQPLATATNPLKNSKSNIKVKSITASRWPYSIHWNKVGHFKNAMTMKKHYGVIYFGSSSLGTPAYEEALYRGYESAMGVLVDMEKLVEGLFEKYLYADDD